MKSGRRHRKTSILEDESIVFFPTFAHMDPTTGRWKVRIHGWIYDDRSRSRLGALTFRLICRMAGINRVMSKTPMFQERSRPFLVNTRGGKRLAIRIGDEVFELSKSTGAGHFEGTVELSPDQMQSLMAETETNPDSIAFAAVTHPGDARAFAGTVRLIPQTGLSVVSDIDDTIKHSHVADRRRLLVNTFLRDFAAVPGMAPLYQQWAKHGAQFHYVSASPWQLFEPLEAFLKSEGFPPGTFHLKFFRPKSVGVWRLFASPKKVKGKAIQEILTSFPQRTFIMVGDSGQHDPEIYGRLFRENPGQVGAILIRNVNGENERSERMRKAFAGLPRNAWALFDDPRDLEELDLPAFDLPPSDSPQPITAGPDA
jgi:hypothetical protein